ncbi:general substrate transporter [Zychaea mexicana]|uniref:general substrate transporter n=1 Tax=Zychaea mexicana TaxID=64656 RepID=UPI0022FF314B|nr:general substrate transporter [Zychaea mexicana]KAI9498269.1 general substrate transporter [Zychaea mexicana]
MGHSFNFHRHFYGSDLVLLINLAAGLSIFFFGYDQGVMSGVNISPDYINVMGLHGRNALLGGVVAVYYAGTLIGALMGGWIGDKIGRIKTVVVGSLIAIVGAVLQTAAQNVGWMMASRVITGIGTGHLNAIVPVWSAETSHHTSRGMFIAMEFTLNIFGVVVAYWLDYGMSYTEGGLRWRFPIAFQLIPLAVLAVGINFFPESPRWLAKVGRLEEAIDILSSLRGNGDPDNPEVQKEYNQIIEAIHMEAAEGEPTYYSMLFHYDKLNIPRRVHLSIWLQILQELTGIGVITVYAPTVFLGAGFSERTSQLLSGFNNIFYMLCTIVPVFTIDRWGRRFTLFYGAVMQGICLVLVAVLTKPSIMSMNSLAYGIAATVFTFGYTGFFGMTWLAVPWIYPVEIYPTRVRARGGAWSVVGWSIGNALIMEITPPMIAQIGWASFLVFAAFNFLTIPIVWALYPETSSKTLEELDIVFSTKSMFVFKAEKELTVLKERNGGTIHLGDTESMDRSPVDIRDIDKTPSAVHEKSETPAS